MKKETVSIDKILSDPDYDQSQLQAWFRDRYGDAWWLAWNRYQETGVIPRG